MHDNPTESQTSAAPKAKRIVVWKLILGALLLLAGLNNIIFRPTGPLEPSNETQWMGYYFVTFIFLFVGLIFVLFGTRVLPRKPN